MHMVDCTGTRSKGRRKMDPRFSLRPERPIGSYRRGRAEMMRNCAAGSLNWVTGTGGWGRLTNATRGCSTCLFSAVRKEVGRIINTVLYIRSEVKIPLGIQVLTHRKLDVLVWSSGKI